MRLACVPRLRCPACLARGEEASFEVDAIRVGGGEDGGRAGDLVEAYLVCRRCRAAHPVLGGIGVLAADVVAHLATHGNVYRRTPIADPRLTRFVLGHAADGSDVVPFAEVVARYGDLLPAGAGPAAHGPADVDAALEEALAAAGVSGTALDVGCGVGRGTFVLAARVGDAVGVDRSVARVRRARNVQSAEEFHLPAQPGARAEVPIDLTRLSREPVDFLVADPDRLPFGAGSFAAVVVRAGDGEGPWPDPDAVLREARRVAGPRGLVLRERPPPAGERVRFEPVPPTDAAS